MATGYLSHLLLPGATATIPLWGGFAHGAFALLNRAWWGVLAGMLAVGLMSKVPHELVSGVLGPGGRLGGLLRATLAGLLLDLCNHGILMVGAQLYRRGASLGQTVAFLVASPWNSLSVSLVLISLIGLKWTLVFIALSLVVAWSSGAVFELLVARGILPPNPHTVVLPADFRLLPAIRRHLAATRFDRRFWADLARSGWVESKMILRWLFFGFAVAAAVQGVVPDAVFGEWFGPTTAGLLLTLLAATAIEVCSEGSSPIAADLLRRAAAPGNAFAFLMAGASTDYTEILVLRETTRSWKISLFLPLITTPQIMLLAWLLNHAR